MFYSPDQFKTDNDIHAEFDRINDAEYIRWLKDREHKAELDRRLSAMINTGSARLPDDVQVIPDNVVAIDPRKKCIQCHGAGVICEDSDGSSVQSVCKFCLGTGRDSVVLVA